MSRMGKFLVLAIVVCALGVGFAVYQKKKGTGPVLTTAEQQTTAATQTATQPAGSTAVLEAGKIVPNAPPMPEPAAGDAPAAVTQGTDQNAVAPQAGDKAAEAVATPSVAEVPATTATAPMGAAATSVGVATSPDVVATFSLTDHNGNAVTEKSWAGKNLLVFFGFTHCPDICPATLQKISAVMDGYDAQGAKLQPLFITVDPAQDTKEVMAAYMAHYNAHALGLVGSKDQIDQAINAFKVYAAKTDAGFDHSSYVYLLSPEGKLLEALSSGLTAEELTAKIKAHLEPAVAPAPATTAVPAPTTVPEATPAPVDAPKAQ